MNDPADGVPANYWFPAKTYGWGWGPPATWQGWLVLVSYIVALTLISVLFPPPKHVVGFGIGFSVATLLVLVICWLKGEPPRWRWGK